MTPWREWRIVQWWWYRQYKRADRRANCRHEIDLGPVGLYPMHLDGMSCNPPCEHETEKKEA